MRRQRARGRTHDWRCAAGAGCRRRTRRWQRLHLVVRHAQLGELAKLPETGRNLGQHKDQIRVFVTGHRAVDAACGEGVAGALAAVNQDGLNLITTEPPETAYSNEYMEQALAELADEGVEVTGEYTPIEVELTEGGM